VPLRDDGRPAELPCPVTGLTGIDVDIATRRQAARTGPTPPWVRRGRGRSYEPSPPVDGPAHDLTRNADHLADLVHAGQLTPLRMRV
jgi:hypothetical protein